MQTLPSMIPLPEEGTWLLERLWSHGYATYAVGGCVRDALLHLVPHDWDFCTAATPEQIQACFPDVPCLTVGSHYGTIGVFRNGCVYEVTTFRKESTYSDHRHPETVQFTDSLTVDLQRRDFTINAMAYAPQSGLIDPFQGALDLQNRQLRCVGNPIQRMEEDALRILRGIRFSATYQLELLPETMAAMLQTAPALQQIAVERITTEWERTLTAPAVSEILAKTKSIWLTAFPEFAFLQQNSDCTPASIQRSALFYSDCQDAVLCWAAFFWDVCSGSDAECAATAKQILHRLRLEKKKATAILELLSAGTELFSSERPALLQLLHQYGIIQTKRLFAFRKAILQASGKKSESAWAELEQAHLSLQQLLQEQACFQLQDLAIRGRDLLALGIPQGRQIGDWLQAALEQVLQETLPNERTALLQWIQSQL